MGLYGTVVILSSDSSNTVLKGMNSYFQVAREGFGAEIFRFWMSLGWSSWWLLHGDQIVWLWVSRPVLCPHPDSHHPRLPRSHPAAEGWTGGLLHEHSEHRAAGPEVSPRPSVRGDFHIHYMCITLIQHSGVLFRAGSNQETEHGVQRPWLQSRHRYS